MKTMFHRMIACALCILLLLPGAAASADSLRTGDYVRFGQDYVWQVVNVENGLATLLLDGYMTGVFDASMHMETHSISLMQYNSYGSVSWEYSDLRQWLNARDNSPRYRDVAFDYGDMAQGMSYGALRAVNTDDREVRNPYSDRHGFLNVSDFSEHEYWLIEPIANQHLIPNTQANIPMLKASEFKNFAADMNYIYGERIQGTIERSSTVDRVFVLSGREVKEYLLDHNLAVSKQSDGQKIPAYWLRDSVYVDEGNLGYFLYYGLYQLVAGAEKASAAYADNSAAIRPACVINLSYVTGLSGAGTAADPYVLQISPTVVRRALPALGSPATDVTVLDSSVTRSTFTDEQHSMRANGKTVASSVLVTSQPIRNCTELTLELRVTDLVRGNVEGDWAFLYRDMKGDWNVGGVFALDGDSASARLEFPEPVSFDAWTVPCLCLGDEWQFNYSVWLDNVCVTN